MLTEMKIKTMIKELEKNNKEISKIRESINDFIDNKNRLIERLEKNNERTCQINKFFRFYFW